MAINPLNAAMAAVQLGSGIAAMSRRMRDRSGQNRIRDLLAQAQSKNIRGAQRIMGSGEGINPALAQRSALEYLTQANEEAAQSAMNQEAAMAERDRARTDRLTGGMLGSLGAFGAQLLSGQDSSDSENTDTDKSAKFAPLANAPTPTSALDRLSADLDSEPQGAFSRMPFIAGQRVAPAVDRFRGGLQMPGLGQQAGVGQRNFQPRLTGIGGPLTMPSLPNQADTANGTISRGEMIRRLRERGGDFTLAPRLNRPTRQEEIEAGRVQWDNPSAYVSGLRRQGITSYGGNR